MIAKGDRQRRLLPRAHRPVAKEEVHILLIEPAGTLNTGDPATAAARRVI
jgi:hypothetical protein